MSRTIILTDANYGSDVEIRADFVAATTIAAETTYRDSRIPDGTFRSTLVYTTGGNCLPVRESTTEVWKRVEYAQFADLYPAQCSVCGKDGGKPCSVWEGHPAACVGRGRSGESTEQSAQEQIKERDYNRPASPQQRMMVEQFKHNGFSWGDLPEGIRQLCSELKPPVQPHEWDNMNISEQRDWAIKQLGISERFLKVERSNHQVSIHMWGKCEDELAALRGDSLSGKGEAKASAPPREGG